MKASEREVRKIHSLVSSLKLGLSNILGEMLGLYETKQFE